MEKSRRDSTPAADHPMPRHRQASAAARPHAPTATAGPPPRWHQDQRHRRHNPHVSPHGIVVNRISAIPRNEHSNHDRPPSAARISQRTAVTTTVRVPNSPARSPLIRRGIVVCRPVDILLPSLHQLGRRVNRHDMRRTDVQASEPRTDTHRRRSRSQLGTDLPARDAPIPRSPFLSPIRLGRHGSGRRLLPDRNSHHHLAPDLSPPLLPEYCRWSEGRERTGHGILRDPVLPVIGALHGRTMKRARTRYRRRSTKVVATSGGTCSNSLTRRMARARPRRPESRIRRTSSRSTGLSASILIDWRAVDMMEILALTLPSSRGSDPTIDREHQEKHKQKPAEHEEDERTIEH